MGACWASDARRSFLFLAAASLLLAACAHVEPVGNASYAPLSSAADVSIFTAESQVTQPFEVIGQISYANPGKFQILSLTDSFEPLRAKAREIGANGVIIDNSHAVVSGIISRGISVKARAIRLQSTPAESPHVTPAAAQSPSQESPKDAAQTLRELRRLHDDGVISDGEYETKKAEILRRM